MGRAAFVVGGLLFVVASAACSDGETAMVRGDQLWADSLHEEALAEYRLAMSQSGGAEDALLRAAHAFAVTGDFDGAYDAWDRLLEEAPEYADQAVFDFLSMARRERAAGNRYGLARAVEAALEIRPDLPLEELNMPLGDYYAELGDDPRALRFYERALAHVSPEAVPDLLYLVGELHQQAGECGKALDYFRAYRRHRTRGARAREAAWHQGNCAFLLGRAAQQAGEYEEAMGHLDMVVELGTPANVQEDAWLLRGEILFATRRYDEALTSYRRVLELNPQRTGRTVERALERIDSIRFGHLPEDPTDDILPLDVPILSPDTMTPPDTFPPDTFPG